MMDTYIAASRKDRCRSRRWLRLRLRRCQLNKGHFGNHYRGWIEGMGPNSYYANQQWR